MRVVHVITGLGQGGAEAVLYRLVETPMTGCEHVVISLTTEGVYGERLRALGIPVHALHMRGLADLLGVVRRLVRLLRSLRPDVIQTWMYHADLVGGIAAKLVGKPVVWGVHHSSLEKKYTKRSTRLVAGALARISHFVPGAIVSCSVKATGAHGHWLLETAFQGDPERRRCLRISTRRKQASRVACKARYCQHRCRLLQRGEI